MNRHDHEVTTYPYKSGSGGENWDHEVMVLARSGSDRDLRCIYNQPVHLELDLTWATILKRLIAGKQMLKCLTILQ